MLMGSVGGFLFLFVDGIIPCRMCLYGKRSSYMDCWQSEEQQDHGGAGKSWRRQGKGHLGDAAGGFSLQCCCHRQGCLALANAGVLHGGPPKMAESSSKSPLWHQGWAAAGIARLLGPRLSTCLHSIPLQTPIPHQLALRCAAYEMEEIKLQYLKIGRARCNI